MSAAAQLVITGASGQLARAAAEHVLRRWAPERLTLITRNPAALGAFAARGVQVRYGDFDQPRSLPAAFAGGARLLLVSATDLTQRGEQHGAAIRAAEEAGVRHVIYTSGLAPAPPNPAVVAPSHYATEQALAASGLVSTVLRNSLYADYQLAEAARAIETGVLAHNRGEGAVAYVARDDCAAVAAAVLMAGGFEGRQLDVTGPATFTAVELAALYAEIGGKPVVAQALDDEAFIAGIVGDAGADGHLRYGAELVASFGRSIREGYMGSCTAVVEEVTGRAARPLSAALAMLRASAFTETQGCRGL
jgi:NAD(P)H dehydrogenase (quinone)